MNRVETPRHFLPLRIIAWIPLVLLLAAGGCSSGDRLEEETWLVMGTFARVVVPHDEREALAQYSRAARDVMRELESELSVFNPDSEISRLNREAGRGPVRISSDTRAVLRESLLYAKLTHGAFDPTVSPLVRLWGLTGKDEPERTPSDEQIAAALKEVGYSRIILENDTAFLKTAGMAVDFGGIAKGYAVDVCWEKLASMGAKSGMINLGGNIRSLPVVPFPSPRADEHAGAWRIGVRDPFHTDEILGVVRLAGGLAVATSGNYERFVTIAGKRYAHIIDPRTGRPVSGMASVTVVAPAATQADALSTGFFVMGMEKSRELARNLEGCRVLMIPDKSPIELHMNRGFREIFEPEPEISGHVTVW